MTAPPTSADEAWLASASRRGETGAWRQLVESNYASVAAYLRWRCGGRADLEDEATQQTWLTAARRIGAFEPQKGCFAAWVCGVAANSVRSVLRQQRRSFGRMKAFSTIAEPFVADGTDIDRERVALALAELRDDYELVLRQKYFEGLSVVDIAGSTKQTAKAVESLLTRARQAFRDAYARAGGEPK